MNTDFSIISCSTVSVRVIALVRGDSLHFTHFAHAGHLYDMSVPPSSGATMFLSFAIGIIALWTEDD